MSHYGPPGGPPSGQPPDPSGYPERYDEPSDPWGGHDAYPPDPPPVSVPSANPGSPVVFASGHASLPGSVPGEQTMHQPGFPPAPAPAFPAPPRNRGNGLLIGLIAVLAVLVLGGGGVALYLLSEDSAPPAAGPGATASGYPDSGATTAEPTPAEASPSPEETTAPVRLVEVGQCVRNDGTLDEPRLVVTECGPETYEVLARIDGRTTGSADARRKCASVPGYTQWYYYDADLDDLDFVLCLKER